MPLILAIEPDRHQASQLRAMAGGRLRADLVLADSAAPALIALGGRVPDLILVPALLSPADETAIGDHLRVLDAASAHVQTLIIPVLAATRPKSRRHGVLAKLKRKRASAPEGCDPREFAEQCATYLKRTAAERARRAEADADAAADAIVEPLEPLVEAPAEPAAEAAAETAVSGFEFVELDLSALLDELSRPETTAPATAAAREIAVPTVAPTVESTEIWQKPAAPRADAGAWTEVWLPPGRSWPTMEGVAVEIEPKVIPRSPSRRSAAQPVTPAKPAPKPVQDEWGFFDPARCGFTALLLKLDEITGGEEGSIKQRA
ncbi:MAG: hypothetical protein HY048_00430 [Acidobacteria bacterium]|nr:hypothetical protein [Acidobacteriota bacterium]